MFSRKKKLVVAGCSMTANYVKMRNNLYDKTYFIRNMKTWVKITWNHIEEFPTLVDVLAEKYDMKPVNLSISGSSNEFIFYNAIDYVAENYKRIGFFSMNWTNMNRWNTITTQNNTNKYTSVYAHQNFPVGRRGVHDALIGAMDSIGAFDVQTKVTEDMRYMFLFQEFMDYYDIPYVQSSSLVSTFDSLSCSKTAEIMLKAPYTEKIDNSKFYGWPIHHDLGGDHLCHNVDSITSGDKHPNEEGHIQMAERLMKFIEENNLMRK